MQHISQMKTITVIHRGIWPKDSIMDRTCHRYSNLTSAIVIASYGKAGIDCVLFVKLVCHLCLFKVPSELVPWKRFVKGGILTLNAVVRGRQGIADTNAVQSALENLTTIAVMSPSYH